MNTDSERSRDGGAGKRKKKGRKAKHVASNNAQFTEDNSTAGAELQDDSLSVDESSYFSVNSQASFDLSSLVNAFSQGVSIKDDSKVSEDSAKSPEHLTPMFSSAEVSNGSQSCDSIDQMNDAGSEDEYSITEQATCNDDLSEGSIVSPNTTPPLVEIYDPSEVQSFAENHISSDKKDTCPIWEDNSAYNRHTSPDWRGANPDREDISYCSEVSDPGSRYTSPGKEASSSDRSDTSVDNRDTNSKMKDTRADRKAINFDKEATKPEKKFTNAYRKRTASEKQVTNAANDVGISHHKMGRKYEKSVTSRDKKETSPDDKSYTSLKVACSDRKEEGSDKKNASVHIKDTHIYKKDRFPGKKGASPDKKGPSLDKEGPSPDKKSTSFDKKNTSHPDCNGSSDEMHHGPITSETVSDKTSQWVDKKNAHFDRDVSLDKKAVRPDKKDLCFDKKATGNFDKKDQRFDKRDVLSGWSSTLRDEKDVSVNNKNNTATNKKDLSLNSRHTSLLKTKSTVTKKFADAGKTDTVSQEATKPATTRTRSSPDTTSRKSSGSSDSVTKLNTLEKLDPVDEGSNSDAESVGNNNITMFKDHSDDDIDDDVEYDVCDEDQGEELVDVQSAVKCIFCNVTALDAPNMFLHCLRNHNFDILTIFGPDLRRLSQETYTKFINYCRLETPRTRELQKNLARNCQFFNSTAHLKSCCDLQDEALNFDVTEDINEYIGLVKSASDVNDSHTNSVRDWELLYVEWQCLDEIDRLRQECAYKTDMLTVVRGMVNRFMENSDGLLDASDKTLSRRNGGGDSSLLSESSPSEDNDTGYSEPTIHREMLQDKHRTQTYLNAIDAVFCHLRRHKMDIQTVLDIGSGTGILAMAVMRSARKHGFRNVRVVACECTNIINEARASAWYNGSPYNKIEFIHGYAETSRLPVEKVDMIVSEWMGYALFSECMIDSIIRTRDLYLNSDGLMLPHRCSLYACLISDLDAYNNIIDCWTDVYGFKMKAMRKKAIKNGHVADVPADNIISSCETVKVVDMSTCQLNFMPFTSELSFKINRTCIAHGISLFFTSDFQNFDRVQTERLSTAPMDRSTHWHQTTLFLSKPTMVTSDDIIKATLKVNRSKQQPGHVDVAASVFEDFEVYVV